MTRRQLFAAVAGAPVAAAVDRDDDILLRYLEMFPDGPGGTRSEIDVSELIPSLFDAEGNALCATRFVIGRFPDSYNLTRSRPPLNL